MRAKWDLVRHELRTNGKRAALRRARFFFLEPIGKWMLRASYPNVRWGNGVIVHGKLELLGPGRVVIGDGCWFSNANGITNRIHTVTADAVVEIGNGVTFGGATIVAAKSVVIGARTMLGPCTIVDTDFHSIDAAERNTGRWSEAGPVRLGEDVWVGRDAMILQGVTVGSRSVIGARSVIRASVPEDRVVVGNPQRIASEVPRPPSGAPLDDGTDALHDGGL